MLQTLAGTHPSEVKVEEENRQKITEDLRGKYPVEDVKECSRPIGWDKLVVHLIDVIDFILFIIYF